jgi:hypothetical protein
VADLTSLPLMDSKPDERHAGHWQLPGEPTPLELGPDRLLKVIEAEASGEN